jgi:hypothetical protein
MHFVFKIFPSKIVPFVSKCGKIFLVEQVKDDNMASANCMLGNYGYTQTHKM